MMHEKIGQHHLERKAILYVQQSSTHQVLHNHESSALQYAMRDRLTALGWSRIETTDDDLGCSAAGNVTRAGFDRMVAEVCLGKVGAVAAREVSRFARNSRDWQQLIEMCRVVDTVLIDEESSLRAAPGNDRLLLGLKGSLNEYELDLLRIDHRPGAELLSIAELAVDEVKGPCLVRSCRLVPCLPVYEHFASARLFAAQNQPSSR